METKAQTVERWRQEVCGGDDVECTVWDAVQLMVAHLNDKWVNGGRKLQHPILSKVTQIDLNQEEMECTDLMVEISHAMIVAGLEKIYQIEKGQVE